ncbi:MAG: hypothetical protein HY726_22080 [Candidatus Rokubacteria bacterium]|nr:hypothetical protein [Candidatus Rokubacteria bacterium]
MNNPWFLLAAIVAVGVVYVLLPVVVATFLQYRAKRSLRCPEMGTNAEMTVDARRAALTSAVGRPLLRVKSCSLWPERNECRQTCLGLPAEEPEPLRPALL